MSHQETRGLLDNEESFDTDEVGNKSRKVSYEEAIALTGYGSFQYKLLALCGWALSSDAIEILSISFILPPATCDLHLSNSDKGWINSAIFLGMMIGGYMWGTIADLKGRRSTLLISLSINALGGLASSFAQRYWLFLLMRIISGIGVGGSMPVIFAYYTEFQSKKWRGAMISLLATFWMCGNIIAAGLAWIVIPRSFGVVTDNFSYKPWRAYLALCVVPSATSILMFILMPESPKYLMENGQADKALKVLERVYHSNTGRVWSDEYEGVEIEEHKPAQNSREVAFQKVGWLANNCSAFFTSTVALFRSPLTRVTTLMCIIFFTLSFGYYGLFMWFPELFQQIEIRGGSACHLGNASITINNTCVVSSTVYLEGFLTAISNLPGNILTIIFIDRIGRKPLLAGSMVLSGVCVFFIWFLKTKTHSIIMSCVFSGVSVIGFNVLDVLGAELFPTNLRSTATGLFSAIGRIAAILGNQIFGLLVATNCAVPMILVAALLSGGGLSSVLLPNRTQRDLL